MRGLTGCRWLPLDLATVGHLGGQKVQSRPDFFRARCALYSEKGQGSAAEPARVYCATLPWKRGPPSRSPSALPRAAPSRWPARSSCPRPRSSLCALVLRGRGAARPTVPICLCTCAAPQRELITCMPARCSTARCMNCGWMITAVPTPPPRPPPHHRCHPNSTRRSETFNSQTPSANTVMAGTCRYCAMSSCTEARGGR